MYYIQHNGTKRFVLITKGVLGDDVNFVEDCKDAVSYLTFRAADKELHFYQVANSSVVYIEELL